MKDSNKNHVFELLMETDASRRKNVSAEEKPRRSNGQENQNRADISSDERNLVIDGLDIENLEGLIGSPKLNQLTKTLYQISPCTSPKLDFDYTSFEQLLSPNEVSHFSGTYFENSKNDEIGNSILLGGEFKQDGQQHTPDSKEVPKETAYLEVSSSPNSTESFMTQASSRSSISPPIPDNAYRADFNHLSPHDMPSFPGKMQFIRPQMSSDTAPGLYKYNLREAVPSYNSYLNRSAPEYNCLNSVDQRKSARANQLLALKPNSFFSRGCDETLYASSDSNLDLDDLPLRRISTMENQREFRTHSPLTYGTKRKLNHKEPCREHSYENLNFPKRQRVESFLKCQHPGCGKLFDKIPNLKSHMKTHSSERPYKCQDCGVSFIRNHDLKRHQKIHSGVRSFVCSHCGKSFIRQDALTRHLKVDNGFGCRTRVRNVSRK